MITLYNNEFIDEKNGGLSVLNRAFKYGDGLFETIAVIRGEPRFLQAHVGRLRCGARILKMNFHDRIMEGMLMENCSRLIASAGHPAYATLRIYLFREDGGLYCPEGDKANMFITLEASTFRPVIVGKEAGFSEQVVNFQTMTSGLKTMSALHYVLAGLEKKEKSLDEIILKDHHGNISEALSSNIFWKKGDSYYTPSLKSGCIEGIMRNWLIAKLTAEGLQVTEILAPEKALLTADALFTVNAMGLQHILSFKSRQFPMDKIIEQFILEIS